MKIFIFEGVSQLTGNYHPGGGLVVIAKDEWEARERISAYNDIQLDSEDWGSATVLELKEGQEIKNNVFIFPDAGCC